MQHETADDGYQRRIRPATTGIANDVARPSLTIADLVRCSFADEPRVLFDMSTAATLMSCGSGQHVRWKMIHRGHCARSVR